MIPDIIYIVKNINKNSKQNQRFDIYRIWYTTDFDTEDDMF